jgi:hypothetical protein
MSTNEMMRAKLTKRFFLELPEGVFLVSNVFKDRMVPYFAEKISVIPDREKQWIKITELGVEQRLCYIFKDRHHFEKWLNSGTL